MIDIVHYLYVVIVYGLDGSAIAIITLLPT
jgi:hypothetical protein